MEPLTNGPCIGFIRNNKNICSNPILIFGKNNISLGLCNTEHVDSGDKYAPNLQYAAKNEAVPYISDNHNLILKISAYGHNFIANWGTGNSTTCVYHIVIDKSNERPVVITEFLVMDELGLCVNLKYHVAHIFKGWIFTLQCCTYYVSEREILPILEWKYNCSCIVCFIKTDKLLSQWLLHQQIIKLIF